MQIPMQKKQTVEEFFKTSIQYWIFDYVGHIDPKYNKAMDFLEKQDLPPALEIFEKYSNEGDKIAQAITAIFYDIYIPIKDLKKACEWTKKSMKQNFIPAISQYSRFICDMGEYSEYPHISNCLKNNKESYTLTKKAYKAGYIPSIQNFANCYIAGIGVEQNLYKVIELLIEAVEKDKDPLAPGYNANQLGSVYFKIGDKENAEKYFREAAKLEPIYKYTLFIYYMEETNDTTSAHYWENEARKHGYGKEIDDYYDELKSIQEKQLYLEQLEFEENYRRANQRSNFPCYVVTATMGDENHPRVNIIREFRDSTLVNYHLGQQFIQWYYKNGAVLAKFIEKSWILKKLSYYFMVLPISEIINFFRSFK